MADVAPTRQEWGAESWCNVQPEIEAVEKGDTVGQIKNDGDRETLTDSEVSRRLASDI
jgi:hypothetical protein